MSFFLLASTLTTENSTIAANTNIIWNRVHTSAAMTYETFGAFCLVADPCEDMVRTVTAPSDTLPGTASGCNQNVTHDNATISMFGTNNSVM